MPTKRELTEDEVLGMTWWNGLSERARALWLERADSAIAAAAWALFKSDPGVAFEIGLQEGRELAQANRDDAKFGPKEVALYLQTTGRTRH